MSNEAEVIQVMLSEPQTAVMEARTALILDMAGQGAGKTENIAIHSGYMIVNFPEVKGFIAANTYLQLSQSTLNKAMAGWERYYGLTEYDKKTNPYGDYVIDKQPPPHFKRIERLKDYNSTVSFKNGAIIFVGSLDNYKVHDGKEFGWAHLDETKDTKKEALTSVILARLRQYGLWTDQHGEVFWKPELRQEEAERLKYKSWQPAYIHTSPAEGSVDWLLDMFDLSKKEAEISKKLHDEYDYYFWEDEYKTVVIYQTYWNEDNLPPSYIPNQKARMSENEQKKYILGYPFSKSGGEYFPHFERAKHVKKIEQRKDLAVHLTYDFNVMPYVTQLAAQVEYVTKYLNPETLEKYDQFDGGLEPIEVLVISFYKEYCLKAPRNTTEAACQQFEADNEQEMPDVYIYGDASGKNRITGLGSLTQYKIIENALYKFIHNSSMRVPNANMNVLKRRDLIDKIFEGKIPEVEIYFDEEMDETIRDFEFLKQGVDGKLKEKEKDKQTGVTYEKIGHCFVGETLITTINGDKRIDEIKKGDFVLTRKGYKRVLNVFDNGIKSVVNYKIGDHNLICTPDHLIYTKDEGFKKVSDATYNDTFYTFKNKNCIVTYNAKEITATGLKKKERVFDIEVEDQHEYFANGLLVHNCSDAAEYLICYLTKDYLFN